MACFLCVSCRQAANFSLLAINISSPILRSMDQTKRYFWHFLIFPSAIRTLMLSQTLLLIVFFSFSSSPPSYHFSRYPLELQKSVKTFYDIYPQVNLFSERYSPQSRSRMCELIHASPLREPRHLTYYYSEPFRSRGTVVCRQGVALEAGFLGVVCLRGVLKESQASRGFWKEWSDYSIFTALFSSGVIPCRSITGCSLPTFFLAVFPRHPSALPPSSSMPPLAILPAIDVPPSPCVRNWKKSLSEISLVY